MAEEKVHKQKMALSRMVARRAREQATESFMYDLDSRPDADSEQGTNGHISWGSRGDVGLARDHNEDSYLCLPPLFAVSDGMGGEEAGEVASSIAIQTIAEAAPKTADAAGLAAAIEAANEQIMRAPQKGIGKNGMGCTATAIVIENDKMALAHVGDSRCYLLHNGSLVRLTRDHSFVESLVEAGLITTEEARVHPKRHVITRALGSDPDMYADNLTIDIEQGERILLCSDGLSSLVSDTEIEEICQKNKTPQLCADALVSAALAAGGSDNVTVIVIDVLNDGKEMLVRKKRHRAIMSWVGATIALLVALGCVGIWFVDDSYYLAPDGDTPQKVALYQGIQGSVFGVSLSHLVNTTDIVVQDLPEATRHQIERGVLAADQKDAWAKINAYREAIADAKEKAAQGTPNSVSDAQLDNTNVLAESDAMTAVQAGEGGQ